MEESFSCAPKDGFFIRSLVREQIFNRAIRNENALCIHF